MLLPDAGTSTVASSVFNGVEVHVSWATSQVVTDPCAYLSGKRSEILNQIGYPTNWQLFNCTLVGTATNGVGQTVITALMRFADGATAVFEGPAGPPGPVGPGASIPTLTGLYKIVGGVMVAAASLLLNADVDAAAAIDVTKLALAPSDGQVLRRSAGVNGWGAINLASVNAVTGILPTANQASQVMGGDVGGTTAASSITNLAVSKLAPSGTNTWILTTTGGVAVWAAPVVSGITQLTSDVTAGPGSGSQAATVVRLNGATIGAAGALVTGNAPYVSGVSALTYSALNLAGGAGWVTGVLPTANQAAQTLAGDVTGTTAASVVEKVTGLSGTLAVASTAAILQWASTTVAPTLKMADHATTPQVMTIQAANVTTGTGSNLALTSGIGSVANGNVLLQAGGSTIATVSTAAITMTAGKYLAFNNSPSLLVGHIRVPNGTVIIGARSSDGLSDTEVLKTFATTLTLGQATYGSTTVTALASIRLTSGTNTSDSPNSDITFQAQTPFAGATLTHRDPGTVVVNIPLAVAGSSYNGGFSVKYNSTSVAVLGEYNGTGAGTGALWLGANSTATATNNFALYGAAGSTVLNVEAAGTVSLAVNNVGVVSATSTVVTVVPLAGSGAGLVGVSNTGALSFASFASVAGSVTLTGDVTGAASSNVVGKINGTTVPAGGALTTGNGLYVTGVGALSYSALNLAGGANYVTGLLPTANQAVQAMGGVIGGTTAATTYASGAFGALDLSTTGSISLGTSPALSGVIRLPVAAGANSYIVGREGANDRIFLTVNGTSFSLALGHSAYGLTFSGASIGGTSVGGTAFTYNGASGFKVQSGTIVHLLATDTNLSVGIPIVFAVAATANISQADTAVLNTAGLVFTLRGQNTTNGTALGGDVVIASGSGVAASVVTQTSAGSIRFQLGATELAGIRYDLGIGVFGGPVASGGTNFKVHVGPMPGSGGHFQAGFSDSYGCLWALPPATAPTYLNMIMYASSASASFNTPAAGGAIQFIDNGTTFISATTLAAGWTWSATALASFVQADKAVLNTAGGTSTLQAQNTTNGTAAGGNLVLQSGTGVTASVVDPLKAGNVLIKSGAVTSATFAPTLITTTVPIQVASGTDLAINGGLYITRSGVGSVLVGPVNASLDALWFHGYAAAPSSTNYALQGDSTGNTYLNAGGTNVILSINATEIVRVTNADVQLSYAPLTFKTTTISPVISQTLHATTPHPFTIQAQNVTTGMGSDLNLVSGSGSVSGGRVSLKGAVVSIYDNSAHHIVDIGSGGYANGAITWDALCTTGISIGQSSTAVASATGVPLYISAQAATDPTGIGGDIWLSSGAGGSRVGTLRLQAGGVDYLRVGMGVKTGGTFTAVKTVDVYQSALRTNFRAAGASSYVVDTSGPDYTISLDTTAVGRSCQLPLAADHPGRIIAVIQLSGAFAATVTHSGADTVDGAATDAMPIGAGRQRRQYQSDGVSDWARIV